MGSRFVSSISKFIISVHIFKTLLKKSQKVECIKKLQSSILFSIENTMYSMFFGFFSLATTITSLNIVFHSVVKLKQKSAENNVFIALTEDDFRLCTF